jgi:hypothetical protein
LKAGGIVGVGGGEIRLARRTWKTIGVVIPFLLLSFLGGKRVGDGTGVSRGGEDHEETEPESV